MVLGFPTFILRKLNLDDGVAFLPTLYGELNPFVISGLVKPDWGVHKVGSLPTFFI